LIAAITESKGILIVTADHGNADEMYEVDKFGNVKLDNVGNPKLKTSHSLNPVPCYIFDPSNCASLKLMPNRILGISSLAATVLTLLGFEPPEDYDPSIVEVGLC
jgi:2,3-bisphosphoglycerate-independent phosphoglycerate mutase